MTHSINSENADITSDETANIHDDEHIPPPPKFLRFLQDVLMSVFDLMIFMFIANNILFTEYAYSYYQFVAAFNLDSQPIIADGGEILHEPSLIFGVALGVLIMGTMGLTKRAYKWFQRFNQPYKPETPDETEGDKYEGIENRSLVAGADLPVTSQ